MANMVSLMDIGGPSDEEVEQRLRRLVEGRHVKQLHRISHVLAMYGKSLAEDQTGEAQLAAPAGFSDVNIVHVHEVASRTDHSASVLHSQDRIREESYAQYVRMLEDSRTHRSDKSSSECIA